jgi:hypothetical protein
MFPQFSLCIPTMNRWSFLQENLPKYLMSPFVKEIILVDETGSDYEKLKEVFGSEPKIQAYRNQTRLGPFLNKLECMRHASCDWIVMIDSDNFADTSYFEFLLKVFDPSNPTRVYMPCKAEPNFDYSPFSGMILTPKTIGTLMRDKKDLHLTACFNTGNYVLSKLAFTTLLNYSTDELSKTSFCCDVIYANTLLLMNGFEFLVVPEQSYNHVVHEGSVYFEYIGRSRHISEYVHSLFNDLMLKA